MDAMDGRNVTVALSLMPPYVSLKGGKLRGVIGEMWTLLSNHVGLHSHYIPAHHNETWTAGHFLLEGPSSSKVPAKASLAFGYSWYTVYVPESSLLTSNLSYIENWSSDHWIMAIGTTLTYAAMLFAMLRIAERWYPSPAIDLPPLPPVAGKRVLKDVHWRRALGKQNILRIRNEESLGNCMMSGVAAVSGQGGVIYSHVPSIRLMVLSFLLFGMILSSAFSAMLVSQFTTGVRVKKGVDGRLCLRKNSVKVSPKVTAPHETCSGLVCSPHFAVIETPEMVREMHPQCTLVIYRDRLFPFQISIKVLQKAEQELQNALKLQLWKMMESGLASRIRRKWMREPETTLRRRTTPTVSLDQIGGVLSCYLVAVFGSVLVFVAEKFLYHIRQVRGRQRWA